MKTFAERVLESTLAAQEESAPFTPSLAEREFHLYALVSDLAAMQQDNAWSYIRATFKNVGYESLAIVLFKERIAQTETV